MSGSETKRSSLTRRRFLKAVGGAAGAMGFVASSSALAGCSSKSEESLASTGNNDQIFYGTCRGNCAGGCALKIKVRDGFVVQTEMGEQAQSAFNRICPKGLSHAQRTYSPQRIRYPMRQSGGKGSGVWERISWDEAIEEITSKWKQYQAESGNSSIVFSTATGVLSVNKDIYGYLQKLMGGSSTAICYDGAGLSILQKMIGYGLFGSGNNPGCERDSKVVFLVGANAHLALLNSWHFLQEARAAGAKLIHIDPVRTLTSQQCDQFVPIAPGTDAALFLAMTKYCIEQGWADEDYLGKNTVAPFLIHEDTGYYVRMSDLGLEPLVGDPDPTTGEETLVDAIMVWDSETGKPAVADTVEHPQLTGAFEQNGIKMRPVYQGLLDHLDEWSLERASEICDIPVDTIAEMARMFAQDGPSTVYMGFGIDHYNGGHKTYQAIITFLAVTGQFGTSGSGLSGVSSGSNVYFSNPNLSVANAQTGPVVGTVKLASVKEQGAIGDIPLDIRSIFFYGHNYISNVTERLKAIECLKSIDLVVVADIAMNDTTEYADIVLPVCGWMETQDIYSGGPVPIMKLQERAIEPLYESKNDFEIGCLLAERMGFGDKVSWGHEEYLAAFFDNALCGSLGYTLEQLKKEKTLALLPQTDGRYPHGANGVFPTETGKLQFYLEKYSRGVGFEGMDNGDEVNEADEQFATFMPPHEAWRENPLIEKYPLQFMSMRNRFTTHSQFYDVAWFREIMPEPILKLNPDDAAARGISAGDTIRAYNDRGYVVLKAEIDAGLRPGVTVYPKGWQASQFIDGHVSNLTSSYTIPSMYNNYYFDTLCEVERCEED